MRRLLLPFVTVLAGCSSAGYSEGWSESEGLRSRLRRGESAIVDPLSFTRAPLADPELDQALAAGLTLDQVTAAVVQRNPDVLAALERWVGFLEREPQRTALPDPTLRYRYSSMFKMHVVEMMQEVPFPAKLLADGRNALAEARAMRAEVSERANMLREQTVAVLANLHRARREVELVDQNVALMERFVEVARTRYTAGAATQSDVLRAEVERDGLRSQRAVFARDVAIAESGLNVLLDRPADAALGPVASLPDPPEPDPLTVLFERALQQRPELTAARERWSAAGEMLDRAEWEWAPDLVVGGGYVRDFGLDEDEVEVTGGISLPIWIGKIRAGIREAEANVRAAEAGARSARNRILDEVRRASSRLIAAKTQQRILAEDTLPRAQQNVQVSEAAYMSGQLGFLELVDAQRVLLMQQLELERARAEQVVAGAELQRAVGEDALTAGERP